MSDELWLLRHGDTDWTATQQHTGRRDIPLAPAGEAQARRAGELLAGRSFAGVLVSPQARALQTCGLAGYGASAEVCPALVEWDYGEYEGLTDDQTLQRAPGWDLFRDGCPGGESPADVERRVERVLARVGEFDGPCLLVSHGKLLRSLAAVWLGQGIELGRLLALDPASLSVIARSESGPLLRTWNVSPEGLPV